MKLIERIEKITDSLVFVVLGFISSIGVVKGDYPLWYGAVIAVTGLVLIYVIRWMFKGRE